MLAPSHSDRSIPSTTPVKSSQKVLTSGKRLFINCVTQLRGRGVAFVLQNVIEGDWVV
jgi:hypothetical protein